MPKYEILDYDLSKEMLRLFKGEKTGWVQVGEKKYFFPYEYTNQGQGFHEFKFKPRDVVVMSYPRSGTTWTQELVWLVANNLDFQTAKSKPLSERFPFLEFSMMIHPQITEELIEFNKGNLDKQYFCKEISKPGYDVFTQLLDPRFLKTHIPLSLFPKILDSGCKLVYVARNPKDVAVSWYYQHKYFRTLNFVGDFPTFWKFYKNDLVVWSPYWEHLKEAWNARNHPNVLFLFYEEIYNQNLKSVIERVSNFFNKEYNAMEIEKLIDHLDIKNFKNNPMVNSDDLVDCGIMFEKGNFVRRGICGEWKETFTPELDAEADEWIADNLMDCDLKFPVIKPR